MIEGAEIQDVLWGEKIRKKYQNDRSKNALSIITLNGNGLTTSFKRQKMANRT